MTRHNQSGGLRRIWKAAFHSLAGIRAAWKNEAAFRQEIMLCLVLIPVAFWYGTTAVERVLLICSCLMVLAVELLNSAVEAAIDRIGEERHELSGRAKDMGSAAVLVSLLSVFITWGLIGYQRFLS
jgi:diacylglycerol kinase (ATP)